MKNLQIILIVLFLVVSVVFCAFFCYDRLMVDREAPTILCDGTPLEVSVTATDRELCAGLTATDNVDGDLTDRIVVRKVSQLYGSNTAMIQYAVFDSSSNVCTYSRSVTYTDYSKPRFSLSQPLIYNLNSIISLSDRLTATDSIDGDISQRIRVATSSVSSSEKGLYPITVQVTNSSGDTAVATMTVTIENVTSRHPVIRLSEYLIYADADTQLDEEALRGYIVSAKETSSGQSVDFNDISIDARSLDLSTRGCYDITYSYTNAGGLTYNVILTVVVE